MRHLPFAAAIVAIVILAGMLAVSAMGIMPSQEQILSCERDADRLCSSYPKNQVDQIRACLEANKKQLSPHCKEVIK